MRGLLLMLCNLTYTVFLSLHNPSSMCTCVCVVQRLIARTFSFRNCSGAQNADLACHMLKLGCHVVCRQLLESVYGVALASFVLVIQRFTSKPECMLFFFLHNCAVMQTVVLLLFNLREQVCDKPIPLSLSLFFFYYLFSSQQAVGRNHFPPFC